MSAKFQFSGIDRKHFDIEYFQFVENAIDSAINSGSLSPGDPVINQCNECIIRIQTIKQSKFLPDYNQLRKLMLNIIKADELARNAS